MRLIWSALVLMLAIGVARADDKAKARVAFKSATQHFRLAEYEAALSDFKDAYRNFADPTFLYNIAQCERQLGRKEEAVRTYRNYLAEVPDSPKRPEIEAHITKLEAAISEERAAADAQRAQKAEPAPALTPAVVAAPPAPPPKQPLYKKWWLWTIVGVGAVGIGLGVGLGVGLHAGTSGLSGTTFGVVQPFK
jgi:tetratricopeptide (TPR) repeat protein